MKLIGDMIAVMIESEEHRLVITPDWTRSLKGRVAAVGPDCHELKTDDIVTFGAATGMEARVNGHNIRMMREPDVDMVLE